jgi:hypothetical protein
MAAEVASHPMLVRRGFALLVWMPREDHRSKTIIHY